MSVGEDLGVSNLVIWGLRGRFGVLDQLVGYKARVLTFFTPTFSGCDVIHWILKFQVGPVSIFCWALQFCGSR